VISNACFYFTVVAWAFDHVVDVAVEVVGVHDPRAVVLALRSCFTLLRSSDRVVVAGQRVEALEAAVLVVFAGVRGLVQRQVDRDAARRGPRRTLRRG
jgi:hypothetical protein